MEETYNSFGKLASDSGIVKRVYEYDQNGNLILEEYYDDKLELKDNGSGVAKIKYIYIEGKKIEEYMGGDGNSIPFGITKKVYTYNNKGQVISEQYFNSEKNLVEDSFYGIAEIVYSYNDAGKKTKEAYYGSNSQLKENVYGIAKKVYLYDQNLNKKQIKYFGKNGQLKGDKNGIASIHYVYDKQGHKIEENYRDTKGNLKENSLGIATKLYRYGKDGKLILVENRNLLHYLQNDDKGIARYKYAYDYHGRKVLEELYNSNEVLVHSEYHKYFPNPYGKKKNKIVHLTLDKFYRPISFEFVSD